MLRILEYQAPEPYREIWDLQHRIFYDMVNRKREEKSGVRPQGDEYILLLEHEPVLTLGRHGHQENLINETEMRRRGIECIPIERGGDITYHGPGQLVAYVLIDLENHRLGVKSFVDLLEEAVIRTIAEYGIKGERVEGATGVWIDKGTASERKICAIGVKCTRFITMHGLALNVNTDLDAFNLINPCGFTDKGVTSIARETGAPINFDEVRKKLGANLKILLEF